MTRDELILGNMGIVGAVIRREFGDAPRGEWADLAGWGVIGLIRAADADAAGKRREYSFSSYAYMTVKGVVANAYRFAFIFRPPHMARAVNRRNRTVQHPLHGGLLWPAEPTEGERDAEVAEALDLLPADERQAVLLRVVQERTLPEVAAEMGRPGEATWAHATCRRGLRRLRRLLTTGAA